MSAGVPAPRELQHLAGAWYPEYGYEAPECIGLCGRPAETGQRLYDEMFGEWQPACAECVTDVAGVPTPRELQRAEETGLLSPHERLSEISPERARELGRQLSALWELWRDDTRLAVGTESEVKRAAQALVDEAAQLADPRPELRLRTDLYLTAPDGTHRGQRCDCHGEVIRWIDVDW
jgi:hypothetical protein